MKFDLILLYDKNLVYLKKKSIIFSFNIYSFYIYIFWSVYFMNNYKQIKKSKLRFDGFIGQLIGVFPKLLSLSSLNYAYIEGVEVFRLIFLKSKGLLKFYEVTSLKNIFFKEVKKKQKYQNKKKYVRLSI